MWADAALYSALFAAAGHTNIEAQCSATFCLQDLAEDAANKQPMRTDAALRSALVAAARDADVRTRYPAIGGLVSLSKDEANRQPMLVNTVPTALVAAADDMNIESQHSAIYCLEELAEDDANKGANVGRCGAAQRTRCSGWRCGGADPVLSHRWPGVPVRR